MKHLSLVLIASLVIPTVFTPSANAGFLNKIAKSAGKASASGPFDFDLVEKDAAAATKKYLKVTTKKSLRGVSKKVFIPTFRVKFTIREQAKTKGRGKTGIGANLIGITPEDYQAITDKAYAKFTADLTAAGYTVVPMDEMKVTEGWARLFKKKKRTNPTDDRRKATKRRPTTAWTSTYSPTGLPQYPRVIEKGAGTLEHKGVPKIAAELDASPVIVELEVPFAQFAASSGLLAMGSTSRASYVDELAVKGQCTSIARKLIKKAGKLDYFGKPMGTMRINGNIAVGTDFAETSLAKDLEILGQAFKGNNLKVDIPAYTGGILKGVHAANLLWLAYLKQNS